MLCAVNIHTCMHGRCVTVFRYCYCYCCSVFGIRRYFYLYSLNDFSLSTLSKSACIITKRLVHTKKTFSSPWFFFSSLIKTASVDLYLIHKIPGWIAFAEPMMLMVVELHTTLITTAVAEQPCATAVKTIQTANRNEENF